MAVVDDALKFCSTFEAEVLLEMMLRYWGHPLASDEEFRNDLLEKSTSVLIEAQMGTSHLEDLPAPQMNFVAAVWFVESAATGAGSHELPQEQREKRMEWLRRVHHALPSCFTNQDSLW